MDEFMKQLVRDAGKIAMKSFGKSHTEYAKEDILDIATETDIEINEFIENEIKSKYSEHGIISEEAAGYKKEAEYIWTIDPIDGTANFATGIPIFVIMVALIKNGEVEMSAIFDPVHNNLAFARKNEGAFVNNKKINCSSTKEIYQSRGLMSFLPKKETILLRKEIFKKAQEENVKIGINAFGCAGFNSMCVAEGKRDWNIGYNTKIWDLAPAVLLMKEAGCKVSNHKGEPWKLGDAVVAANERLHSKLIEILNNINFKK